MDENRLITTTLQAEDREMEYSLRPRTLSEYIGQEKSQGEDDDPSWKPPKSAASLLTMCCCTARPGLGKTTLASIIANEMNVNLRITSGPAIERAADLAAILTNLGPGGCSFYR